MNATPGDTPVFDIVAERYADTFVDREHQIAAGEWLINRTPSGGRVLDLGCGAGVPTARQFHKAGLHVVGVDESNRMLTMAREAVPEADFVHGDIRTLDAALGTFEAATAFFSFPMLSRADIDRVLWDVRTRLRGPRSLALSMVHGDFDAMPICFLGTPVKATAYPKAQLCRVVEAAGFVVDSVWEAATVLEPLRVERQLFVCATAVDEPADGQDTAAPAGDRLPTPATG